MYFSWLVFFSIFILKPSPFFLFPTRLVVVVFQNGVAIAVGNYFSFFRGSSSSYFNTSTYISSFFLSSCSNCTRLEFLRNLVFCYQICSNLLWEKIVLVIKKNVWNLRLKAENWQKYWVTRTIHSNSERSEKFLITKCFFLLVLEDFSYLL